MSVDYLQRNVGLHVDEPPTPNDPLVECELIEQIQILKRNFRQREQSHVKLLSNDVDDCKLCATETAKGCDANIAMSRRPIWSDQATCHALMSRSQRQHLEAGLVSIVNYTQLTYGTAEDFVGWGCKDDRDQVYAILSLTPNDAEIRMNRTTMSVFSQCILSSPGSTSFTKIRQF